MSKCFTIEVCILYLSYNTLYLSYNILYLSYNILYLSYNTLYLSYNTLYLSYNTVIYFSSTICTPVVYMLYDCLGYVKITLTVSCGFVGMRNGCTTGK